jgi:AAA15 family ATPase/GTPase
MYNSIHLNSEEINHYKTSSDKEITNLSKINIFIGPNNSGKSRFLRGLFSNKNTEFKSNDINLTIINEAISELKNNIQKYYEAANISSADGINLDLLMPIDFLTNTYELKSIIYDHVIRLRQIKVNAITRNHGSSSVTPSDVSSYVQNVSEKCLLKIDFLETFENSKIQHEHIYIPTLRGLRGIDYETNSITLRGGDNYQIRTKHDYFKDIIHIEHQIYTGLSLYDDVKKLLLGSSPDREKIKKFERFISKTFFDSKEFTIIPHINDNAVHVKIGDEDDYPIYKLGDGIQSIIILTYPLFFNRGKNCVFFMKNLTYTCIQDSKGFSLKL